MIKAAVIGDPISHSLSPKLHGFLLSKYKIDGNYYALHVKKDELENAIKSMVEAGYSGFNVTIPHKEEIFKLCAEIDETASLTKAVNTVTIKDGNKLFGQNSDVAGFINNFKNSHPNESLYGKNAFVVGAGGAARAVVLALINENVKNIYITNRSEEKAEILIKDFAKISQNKINFLDQEIFVKNLKDCDLLVNATALGMHGQPELQLDLSNLKNSAIVYDIVYKPLKTNLLKHAEVRGNKIVTGIGMLAFQAAIGFEQWFGQKPKIDEELLDYLLKYSL